MYTRVVGPPGFEPGTTSDPGPTGDELPRLAS